MNRTQTQSNIDFWSSFDHASERTSISLANVVHETIKLAGFNYGATDPDTKTRMIYR